MLDMNEVTLIGTVGSGYNDNPAVQTRTGIGDNNATVSNFSLVTEFPSRNGGNPLKTFVKINAWNERSHYAAQFNEGDRVFVKGCIKNESFTKQDGTKVNTLSVTALVLAAVDPQGAADTPPAQQGMDGAFAAAQPATAPSNVVQTNAFAGGPTPADDGLPF